MESKNLISMVDFVLDAMQEKTFKSNGVTPTLIAIEDYANFLKRPLTLGMFMPTDEYGKVLDKPMNYDIVEPILKTHINNKKGKNKLKQKPLHDYQQAKERVIFEGVTVNIGDAGYTTLKLIKTNKSFSLGVLKTIEDLVPLKLKYKPNKL